MKLKLFISSLVLLVAVIFSCKKEPEIPSGNKIIIGQTTVDSSSYVIAEISTTITDIGGNTIIEHGHCWSTESEPTIADSNSTLGKLTQPEKIESILTGLIDNTKYYSRSYLSTNAATIYGDEVSFTTLKTGIPGLITNAVSDITPSSAVCGGNISVDSGLFVTIRGLCWDNDSIFTIDNCIDTLVCSDTLATGNSLGSFQSTIENLNDGNKYYAKAYAINEKGIGYGDVVSFSTVAITIPQVTTTQISEISTVSAYSGGNVISDGNGTVTDKGICWNTTGNPTLIDNIGYTTNGQGVGEYSSMLYGLSENTKYYVCAYAINEKGTSYGQVLEFTSLEIGLPVITTTDVTDITLTSAVSGGNITDDGNGTIIARGVCWSISNNPTLQNNDGYTLDGTGVGTYSSNLTGLTNNTEYFVRAYATNIKGTSYGNQISFNTLANPVIPTLTTIEVTSITQTTANSGGNITSDGGADVTSRGVCWSSTSILPEIDDPHTTDGTGVGSYSSLLTNLDPNTLYYLRAYATNNVGTAYGNTITFMTLATPTIPTVITQEAYNITQTEAITGGNVLANGGETVTARGVCYSTSPNPSLSDNYTTDGTGIGYFVSTLSGLSHSTQYYIRAYATNSIGTAYGEEFNFTTLAPPWNCGELLSYEGQDYETILIGTQCWMAENLNVGVRIDGDQEPTDNGQAEKYCYDDDESNCDIYGGLYNWDEVMNYDTAEGGQGLCPSGWHMPTDEEWKILEGEWDINYPVGDPEWDEMGWRGYNIGYRLKDNSWGGDVNFEFNAMPGGMLYYPAQFLHIGEYTRFWTSTQHSTSNPTKAYYRALENGHNDSFRAVEQLHHGYSIRCIKD